MASLGTLRPLALLLAVLAAVTCTDLNLDNESRLVVLVEKHGFLRGRSVDVTLVEAPGLQKLLAVVCKDSTMSLCQGFTLDGKAVHPMLREPMDYTPKDVFEAFFGAPYKSRLLGPDSSGRVLRPHFTLAHLDDGSFEFTYEYKDEGKQKSTIRPKARNQGFDLGFDYLFIGAEVRLGVSDPVGFVSSF